MVRKKLFVDCEVSVFSFECIDIITTSAGNDAFEGEGDRFDEEGNPSPIIGSDCY